MILILFFEYSEAKLLVKLFIADFDDPYKLSWENPKSETIEETFKIFPFIFFF